MKHVIRTSLALMLATLISTPLLAQDEQQPRRQRQNQDEQQQRQRQRPQQGGRQAGGLAMLERLGALNLSTEQQEAVKKLREEFAPKFEDLEKKTNAIVTPEKRRAQQEAMRKAREENKSREEIRELMTSSLGISTEQQETLRGLQRQQIQLGGELREKVSALLTEEQRAAFTPRGQRRPGQQRPDGQQPRRPRQRPANSDSDSNS